MVRHKWQHEGYHYNFCVKCGVKKGWASRFKCHMTLQSWSKKLSHKVEFQYYGKYDWYNYYQCTVCKINNKRWRPSAIIWKDATSTDHVTEMIGYVAYKERERNGKITRCRCRIPKKIKDDDIKYWPIYCPYTEDEFTIKDIIE